MEDVGGGVHIELHSSLIIPSKMSMVELDLGIIKVGADIAENIKKIWVSVKLQNAFAEVAFRSSCGKLYRFHPTNSQNNW